MVRSEAIRDSIHGTVRLSSLERRMFDTIEVSRLRRVSQLGLTELVFPGARHSRFEHALGSLAVVTRLFEELRGRVGLSSWMPALNRTESEFEHLLNVARLVAMLHDLGHTPFSHATESLLLGGDNHEDLTLRLIRSGEVSEVLSKGGSALREDVLHCLDLRRPAIDHAIGFIREVITGPLGADRMDYLLRDSRATGVSYGIFDLDRVIHTVIPLENADSGELVLGIDQGGVLAAEGMLWARASMFGQVYQHRTRRILDIHLREFLGLQLPSGTYPTDLEDYLSWDDARIWDLLRRALSDPQFPGHLSARRILRREHHRALGGPIEGSSRELVVKLLEAKCREILVKIPEADPRVDVLGPPLNPNRGGDIAVRIGSKGDLATRRVPLREVSELVDRLHQKPFGRIYVACHVRDLLETRVV